MNASQLIAHLLQRGVQLWVEGDELCFRAGKGVLTPELRERITSVKPEIIASLREKGEGVKYRECSFAQRRLWFFDQFEPNTHFYNITFLARVEGLLDVAALERGLGEIMRRHETLRTTFATFDGQPFQEIAPSQLFHLPCHDLQRYSREQRESELQRVAIELAKKPFDLSRDAMLRAQLLQLDAREHALLFSMHHIASDGWSINLFLHELHALYSAFSRGEASPLPELATQYGDFATWQRQWLQDRVLDQQLGYWKKQLRGELPSLELPTDRPRPSQQTFAGATQPLDISRHLASSLFEFCRRENVTLFMTLLAAYVTLLYRLCGQNDICVGSPIAGRNRIEIEPLIGFFVNTLVLRIGVEGEWTFREMLQQVRNVALDAFANQDVPFEKLVEELQPPRDPSRTPLFQTMFSVQDALSHHALGDLKIGVRRVEKDVVLFDLALTFFDEKEGLRGHFNYNTALFDAATIERMAQQLATMLQHIVAHPEDKISQLPMLSPEEEHKILVEWNNTRSDYPRASCIHELFEQQVEYSKCAGANTIALRFGDQTISYDELNRRANRLARVLRERGVGRETLIGLCVERSVESIVGVLAILKAGGAYVPFDPSLPEERMAFLLRDTDVKIVLVQNQWREKFADNEICALSVEWLEIDSPSMAHEDDSNLSNISKPSDLAYVMYTSGSTGEPKGVCVEHRSVVRLVKNTNYADFAANEVFAQYAPMSFDASTFEIWGALLNGASLAILPMGVLSLDEIGQEIVKHQVSTLWLTAGLFHQMLDEQIESFRNVRHIVTGGDVVSVSHAAKARRELPRCRLTNGYGPTENTTFSTFHPIEDVNESRSIPIGKPIANTQVYILDNALQPLPVGVAGELCVAGDGLARGYLNASELTTEKFTTTTLNGQSIRLYRTGDRARFRDDGTLEFLGRFDNQIKLRGFRIELGEIEATLRRFPFLHDCYVVLREGKAIVAYVIFEGNEVRGGQTADRVLEVSSWKRELRAWLQTQLPSYMMPSSIVSLDEWPLTANGKIDWRTLPAPPLPAPLSPAPLSPAPQEAETCAETKAGCAVPQNDIESELLTMWKELLNVEQIGVCDNFFDCGGHSMLATQLFAHIKKRWNIALPMAILFQTPTVRELAMALQNALPEERAATFHSESAEKSVAKNVIVPLQPDGHLPPFYIVSPGAVLFLRPLGQCISHDQPLYSVQALGLEEGEVPFMRVEDMAKAYVEQIRTMQPHGPYYLGGRCFGGVVAFEIAQQLRAMDEVVGALIIFDSSPPRSVHTSVSTSVHTADSQKQQRSAGSADGDLSHAWSRLRYYVSASTMRTLWRRRALSRHAETERVFEDLRQANRWARKTYRATQYDGDITLLRSEEFAAWSRKENHMTWQNLTTGKFRAMTVPGTHISMFESPHVEVLARHIEVCLSEARQK